MLHKFAPFDRLFDLAASLDRTKVFGAGALAMVMAGSVFATANTHIEGAVSCRKVEPAFLGGVACTSLFREVAGAVDIPFTADAPATRPRLVVALPHQR
jgi:hypothetical protein